MKKAIKKNRYAALIVLFASLLILASCSSGANQAQTTSQSSGLQSSEGSQNSQLTDDAVFSIDFPAEPTYESSENSGVLSETYTAKADDCYVMVRVDHVSLDLEGDDPYDFAASVTYAFLGDMVNTSVAEDDINKGTFDGRPAGYISLGDQDGGSVILASSMLGDGYVLNLYIKADSEERLSEVMNSFSLKSPNDASAGDYVAESAGFSVAFPGTPTYDSATGEASGYKYTNEYWTQETSSGIYLVSCLTFPSDHPALDNAEGINGGLSSGLLSLCENFDVPTESAEIHYDEFLGCPSAYTTFDFEGYTFMGRDLMKGNKAYTIVAGTSTLEQSEAFINSFRFV